MSEARELAAGVAREFRNHVLGEYVPRIGQCAERLDAVQLWERPGTFGNSVGNLLLHLEGNTRQWILSGIGGDEDRRERDGEFAATEGAPGAELIQALRRTVQTSADLIDALTPAQLLETRRFQGRYDRSCLSAVLHVMEHFSGHAGQIYAHTKRVLDVDLKFWDL